MDSFDALLGELDVPDIHVKLFFVMCIEAVADLLVLCAVELPLVLHEQAVGLVEVLHAVGKFLDQLRIFQHCLVTDEWNFGCDLKHFGGNIHFQITQLFPLTHCWHTMGTYMLSDSSFHRVVLKKL